MSKSKRNYYMGDDTHDELVALSNQLHISIGSLVEIMIKEYKDQLGNKKTVEDQLISQLNVVRKLSSSIEKFVQFLVQMENLSSTLQGYDNFVSMEERINPAVQSAFYYLDEKEKAEFVRQTDSKVKRGEVL